MTPVPLAADVVGSGPAVVLVHGHPFDRTMWRPQLEPLAGRFRVVAPDLRGFGQSPASAGAVTMAELAGDVWALLGRLEIDEAALVGLSMGGLVVMEMALAQPAKVWGLGLVATTAEPVSEDERDRRLAMADQLEAAGMGPLVRSMGPRLFGPGPDRRTADEVVEMMARNDPAGAAAALRGRAARPDYRDGLRALGVPSFVCTGTSDPWSTAEVTAELVDCLSQPQVLTLPDVGHLPNLERPEAFNHALVEFLMGAWDTRR